MKCFERFVEAVTSGIVASPRRKAQMREELLAHLHSAAESEVGEDMAGRVIAGMGEPQALRDELQASVPYAERLLFQRLSFLDRFEGNSVERRPGESCWRYAWRITLGISLLVTPFAIGAMLLLCAFDRGPSTAAGSLWDLLSIIPVFLATLMGFGMAISLARIDRVLSPRSPAPVLIRAVVLLGLLMCWVSIFVFIGLSVLSGSASFAASVLRSMINAPNAMMAAGILFTLALAVVSYGYYRERVNSDRLRTLAND